MDIEDVTVKVHSWASSTLQEFLNGMSKSGISNVALVTSPTSCCPLLKEACPLLLYLSQN